MQGAQLQDSDDGGGAGAVRPRDPHDPSGADLQLEAEQTLAALRAARLIDAAWHRVTAPPATCGDTHDDAPALPVADAAARLGCSRRTVQTHMQARHDIEDAGGQLVLPIVPPVADVYAARPSGVGADGGRDHV